MSGADEHNTVVRAVRLSGGNSLALDFAAGDSFSLSPANENNNGKGKGAKVVVWAFRPDGKADSAALEWQHKTRAAQKDAEQARRNSLSPDVAAAMDFSAPPAAVSGRDSEARILRPCVVVAAVAGRADIAKADADGEWKMHIRRAVNKSEADTPPLLADAREDFLLPRRTGRAYLAREGEYVQVADIFGKQCSDFLAFPLAELDAKRERFIDATVTRSMTGSPATPMPGLCDRFYDQDFQPLMRVVRDTCGRHDTFGIACAGLTYERKGSFNHPNCSDNISAAMHEWGVLPRKAWPAVNFFYNTSVASGAVVGGEGWSRPGDYVLMQALTDLVCVSTACPDDTSPINGWDPTDIQVRVYPKKARFRRAVAFRARPEDEPTLTRDTGFHIRTAPLVRDYAAAKDCWIPRTFSANAPADEYWACREKATMQDLSQLRKFDIAGPDSETLLDYALPRMIARLAPGAALYSPMCRPHGAMFDDGVLMRLSPDGFRWLCGDARAGEWLQKLAAEKKLKNVRVREVTHELCNLAVQGPASRDVVSEVIEPLRGHPQPSDLRRFRFLIGRIVGGGEPVLLSRTGYTGGLGYEIFCAPTDAVAVWDATSQAGESRGVIPMGLAALELLRVEAGMPAGASEFGGEEDVDPFEAGIGFAVNLNKADFVGKDALIKTSTNPRRKLVGLELQSAEVPPPGTPVFADEMTRAGTITSSARLPTTGRAVAMARLTTECAVTGATLEVGMLDGFQKRLQAKVCALPFLRPQGGPARPK